LGVEDKGGEEVAMLRWPWGDESRKASDLRECGFKIV
jgi:hypothetical protein